MRFAVGVLCAILTLATTLFCYLGFYVACAPSKLLPPTTEAEWL